LLQLAFGENSPPEPPDCRRCRITTAPIEIAAKAAIAIRIGTKGEEEESELLLGVEAGGAVEATA